MTADWRQDFWKARETEAEHAERVENAEREARWYFNQATYPQQKRFNETMAYLAPMRGPFWERKRGDAQRIWRESTKEAAALYERTGECVMVTGEVSEALSGEWDELIARNVLAERGVMAMSKHTPGPWTQNRDEQHYIADADIVVGPVDEGKQMEVCIVSEWDYGRKQAKANARLIAAAPDMLDVLVDVWFHLSDTTDPTLRKIADGARAALAKANGHEED